MMFVERTIREGEEVVVLRYAAAFYWWMWPTLALSMAAAQLPGLAIKIACGLAWILLLAVAIPYWPVIYQLKKQMRDASVTAAGSKYSFSNPLTYRWQATVPPDSE